MCIAREEITLLAAYKFNAFYYAYILLPAACLNFLVFFTVAVTGLLSRLLYLLLFLVFAI